VCVYCFIAQYQAPNALHHKIMHSAHAKCYSWLIEIFLPNTSREQFYWGALRRNPVSTLRYYDDSASSTFLDSIPSTSKSKRFPEFRKFGLWKILVISPPDGQITKITTNEEDHLLSTVPKFIYVPVMFASVQFYIMPLVLRTYSRSL